MKTPGRFGIAKELNPEERFVEMERNYSGIIQRIQAYDKVLDDFDKIVKAQNVLVSENDLLKKGLQEANELNSVLNSMLLNAQQEFRKSLQTESNRISTQENAYDLMQKGWMRSESNLISEIEEKHSVAMDSFQRYVKNETLNSVNKSLCSSIDFLNMEIYRLHDSIEKRIEKDQDLDYKIEKLSESYQSIENQTKFNQEELLCHKKDTNFMVSSLRKQIENDVSNVKDQVVTYMDNTKVEMIGSPGSLESVQRSLATRLDSITLDGSNAVLRSSNNEQMIKILEKKVEKISILMKKNEFSKMQDD